MLIALRNLSISSYFLQDVLSGPVEFDEFEQMSIFTSIEDLSDKS